MRWGNPSAKNAQRFLKKKRAYKISKIYSFQNILFFQFQNAAKMRLTCPPVFWLSPKEVQADHRVFGIPGHVNKAPTLFNALKKHSLIKVRRILYSAISDTENMLISDINCHTIFCFFLDIQCAQSCGLIGVVCVVKYCKKTC